MEHGFSFSTPTKKEETFKQPPKDRPVVISIFVKNPESIDKLGTAKLVDHYNKKSEPIELEKIRDDLYVTKPITFPVGKFKIVTYEEYQENIMIVSPTFEAIDPSNY